MYREDDDTTKVSFWTDTVNTGLKKAYEDSKQVDVFCTGIGNAPLPVITVFISITTQYILCVYSLRPKAVRNRFRKFDLFSKALIYFVKGTELVFLWDRFFQKQKKKVILIIECE